ncbi:enoyl-CoA hydratase-related protein [Rhodococcus jostii]|uniref:Crotonobetainyl-CoA hydratase n=1 Tax=Rhodococcus jostii TaxID=132919 RepID=A0A1H5DXY3_RHOJO|nr:enoyl-CoA hydratase-related protein [Rhodococcus jostii]SED83580.1 crotonobetainyl-CoA hydratase [Rhodococcus jostii]
MNAVVDRHGSIAVITLDRPGDGNVADAEMSAAFCAAMDTLAGDQGLRVGIVTGTGDTLCAVADISALTAGRTNAYRGFADFVRRQVGKPLIAAVNGLASDGGIDLNLGCDAAIVSSDATLRPRQARDSVLTADVLEPERALRCGIIDRIVHPHEAWRLARALAVTPRAPEGIAAAVTRRRGAGARHFRRGESAGCQNGRPQPLTRE